jgi:hypothetical protein
MTCLSCVRWSPARAWILSPSPTHFCDISGPTLPTRLLLPNVNLAVPETRNQKITSSISKSISCSYLSVTRSLNTDSSLCMHSLSIHNNSSAWLGLLCSMTRHESCYLLFVTLNSDKLKEHYYFFIIINLDLSQIWQYCAAEHKQMALLQNVSDKIRSNVFI